MGALLVNLGRESGSHDAPLLFSVSHTSQGSPAGIATTLRDPPPGCRRWVAECGEDFFGFGILMWCVKWLWIFEDVVAGRGVRGQGAAVC